MRSTLRGFRFSVRTWRESVPTLSPATHGNARGHFGTQLEYLRIRSAAFLSRHSSNVGWGWILNATGTAAHRAETRRTAGVWFAFPRHAPLHFGSIDLSRLHHWICEFPICHSKRSPETRPITISLRKTCFWLCGVALYCECVWDSRPMSIRPVLREWALSLENSTVPRARLTPREWEPITKAVLG